MDQKESPVQLGIKIERPKVETVHFFYTLLVILSIFLIGFTFYILFLELSGEPLPAALTSAIDDWVAVG